MVQKLSWHTALARRQKFPTPICSSQVLVTPALALVLSECLNSPNMTLPHVTKDKNESKKKKLERKILMFSS